jgi:hypothetical protein
VKATFSPWNARTSGVLQAPVFQRQAPLSSQQPIVILPIGEGVVKQSLVSPGRHSLGTPQPDDV